MKIIIALFGLFLLIELIAHILGTNVITLLIIMGVFIGITFYYWNNSFFSVMLVFMEDEDKRKELNKTINK